MMPLNYITAWQAYAPWPRLSQVEQDLNSFPENSNKKSRSRLPLMVGTEIPSLIEGVL